MTSLKNQRSVSKVKYLNGLLKVMADSQELIESPDVSSDIIFAHIFPSIFDPTSFPIPYSPFPLYAYPCYVSFLMPSRSRQMTRTQFDWYYWSPNNLSTGLPTSQNSPVVVSPHPDLVLEPPPPSLNAPTIQSSGLPGHGARVGVCPLHKDFWSLKGSSLLLQQDCPDQLPPCNKPHPLILRETRHFQPEC